MPNPSVLAGNGPPTGDQRGPRAVCGEALLFLVVWLLLLLAGRNTMLRDPGSLWHVAAGEKMLAAGQVIREDPFSFTFGGRPWVADQWLAECGMAALHRLAGWDVLLLAASTVLAGTYTWIGGRLLRGGLHWLPAGLVLALALAAGSPQFHVRPLVLTIGLLGLTFAWLVDVEAGRKPLRQLWWLVPIYVLWVNLHPGALGGMGTVGLVAAGWGLAWALGGLRIFRPRGDCPNSCARRGAAGKKMGLSPLVAIRRPRDVVELAALLATLAATSLASPYGWSLPREWWATLAMPLPSLIKEHGPLDLADPACWAAVALAIGYLAALLGVLPQRPRVTWLLPLIWFVLAAQRARHAPLFAVTALIGLADLLPHSRVGRWLERRGMLCPPAAGAGWRCGVLPAILVAGVAALQIGGVRAPVVGRGWAQFDLESCPVQLLGVLGEINDSSPDGARVFNDMNFGGFLIYHAPRLRVFVDDRCSLYGADFLLAYDRARREDPNQLDVWRRQYGFDYALVESGGPFDRRLAGAASWVVLGRSPSATLYEWRMGGTAELR